MIRNSFGRSLSFPIPRSHPNAGAKIKGRGSASLPVRFHLFVSHLHDEIRDLLTWRAQSASPRPDPSAWIGDGLARLDHLHSSLDDLLQHPQAQDSLRRRPTWAAHLLDDSLHFADAYSSLRSAVVALRDHQSATQAAIRRNDGPRIASCVRSQRKAEKELIRIAAAVRGAGRWVPAAAEEDAEIAWAVREVSAATAAASAAAIAAITYMSAEACSGVVTSASVSAGLCGSLKGTCVVGAMLKRLGSMKKLEGKKEEENNIKWRAEALRRLEALENCIGEVEARSERLFRSLVNTRVFLLNILTPSL